MARGWRRCAGWRSRERPSSRQTTAPTLVVGRVEWLGSFISFWIACGTGTEPTFRCRRCPYVNEHKPRSSRLCAVPSKRIVSEDLLHMTLPPTREKTTSCGPCLRRNTPAFGSPQARSDAARHGAVRIGRPVNGTSTSRRTASSPCCMTREWHVGRDCRWWAARRDRRVVVHGGESTPSRAIVQSADTPTDFPASA